MFAACNHVDAVQVFSYKKNPRSPLANWGFDHFCVLKFFEMLFHNLSLLPCFCRGRLPHRFWAGTTMNFLWIGNNPLNILLSKSCASLVLFSLTLSQAPSTESSLPLTPFRLLNVKVYPTGSLCQTNTEKVNLTIWGEFTHNAGIKLRPNANAGINYSVYLLQQ